MNRKGNVETFVRCATTGLLGALLLVFAVALLAACGRNGDSKPVKLGQSVIAPDDARFAAASVPHKPVAVPDAFPREGGVPLKVHLWDAGSYDPDGEIVRWEWNFADGGGGWQDFTETQGEAWHVYNRPGNRNVCLRVTDNDHHIDVASVMIEMREGNNANPVAVANAAPLFGNEPLFVSFTATGSYDPDGTIVKYEWDFGSGVYKDFTADGGSATHTYTTGGVYTVIVRVTDDDGAQSTKSVEINVNSLPIAVASSDTSEGDIPLTVAFAATGSSDPDGNIVKYEWNFGDASGFSDYTTNLGRATHTYTTYGDFTATLRVTDNNGATDTGTVPIDANSPPAAVANADPTEGNAPLTVNFSADGSTDPDGSIVKYEWDWDYDAEAGFTADFDGGESPEASNTYSSGGTYQAAVRVTDNNSSTDIAEVTVTANAVSDWIHTFGTANREEAYDTAVDSNGNVYAVGTVYGSGPYLTHLLLISFDSGGSLRWARTLASVNPPASVGVDYITYGFGVATSADNHVYVTGYVNDYYNAYVLTALYDCDGSMRWARKWSGNITSPLIHHYMGLAIDCDSLGNAYIVVGANPGNSATKLCLISYSMEGNLRFQYLYSDAFISPYYGGGIVADSSDRIYIAAWRDDSSPIPLLLCLDREGQIEQSIKWMYKYGIGNSYGTYSPNDICVGNDNRIYVVGGHSPMGWGTSFVSCFDGAQHQWTRTCDFSNDSPYDNLTGVALDGSGHLLCTGMARLSGSYIFRPVVLSLDAITGEYLSQEKWGLPDQYGWCFGGGPCISSGVLGAGIAYGVFDSVWAPLPLTMSTPFSVTVTNPSIIATALSGTDEPILQAIADATPYYGILDYGGGGYDALVFAHSMP